MNLFKIANKFERLIKIAQDEGDVFVVRVEHTDGTSIVAREPNMEAAREAAEKWLGRKADWSKVGREETTISDYGHVVTIGPGRKKEQKGKNLHFGWDYFFETGFGHEYIAKALGFEVNEYGEVSYKDPRREEWRKVIGKIEKWLSEELSNMGIEPYGSDNKIYVADVMKLAEKAKSLPLIGNEVSKGFMDWAASA